MSNSQAFCYAPAGWKPATFVIDPQVLNAPPTGRAPVTHVLVEGLTPVRRTLRSLDDPDHVRQLFKIQHDTETFGLGMEAMHEKIRLHLPSTPQCPGFGDSRCCGLSPLSSCTEGWRDWQDDQWFAQNLAYLWNRIEYAYRHDAYGEAVNLAFTLGVMFHTWGLKGDPEREWQWGRDKRDASRSGAAAGAKARRLASDEQRHAAVQKRIETNPHLTGSSAARAVARSDPSLGAVTTIYTAWKRVNARARVSVK